MLDLSALVLGVRGISSWLTRPGFRLGQLTACWLTVPCRAGHALVGFAELPPSGSRIIEDRDLLAPASLTLYALFPTVVGADAFP